MPKRIIDAALNRRHFVVSVAATGLMGTVSHAATASKNLPYRNAKLPTAERVKDLLGRMTLDEKLAQMNCVWQGKGQIQTAEGQFDPAKAMKTYPHGLGMLARPSDNEGLKPGNVNPGVQAGVINRTARQTADFVNALQSWALTGTRLGIPLFLHEEGLHGYAARDATSFPQAIALASSFDRDMVRDVYAVAAREMRARGANMALAPVVDVAREPRWGRTEETFGEDPYLCAEMGIAAVEGFQGKTLPLKSDKVFATLKHLVGHGQPESGTNVGPANVPERVLRDVFLYPFEKVIARTQVAAVMPSYNEVDGLPSHANRWLLTDVLRDEWNFKGITVSDYGGINSMVNRHKLAADSKAAGLIAFKAGVDIETPEAKAFASLKDWIADGKIAVAEIDAVVARILTLKFDGGLFENPYADAKKAEARTATAEAVVFARAVAVKSAVLLKNDKGVLPLNAKTVGKLLVLGTHARDTPIGGYSDVPRKVVSVLEGLQAEGKRSGFEVAYSEGVRITEERIWGQDKINFTPDDINDRLIRDALEAAKSADTIVMVLGDNEMTAREAWANDHLGDRQTLDLIGRQNDLAKAIFDLGKPTVVFLLNGRPLSVNLLAERADAIIEGWYLGQETGHAAADLLFGRANPGGKLPVSIARHVGQLPVFYNHKPSARRGYIDGETTPLYPFGFGLSYTTFDLSPPRLNRPKATTADTVRIEVDVSNTGKVTGDEVVQLYIADDVSSVTRPVKELKDFRRITLKPGETRTVVFDLSVAELGVYGTDMTRRVEPGTFTLMTGNSSADLSTITLEIV